MKRKRKVLSLWATLLLVLGAFVVLIGATALGLFLTGQLEKKIVEPQDLGAEVGNDSQAYSDGNGNFYAADDFYFIITSTTENVTEKKITLSIPDARVENGYLINSVLKVKQEVEIGKPYLVTLTRNYDPTVKANVVAGGQCPITAKSVTNVLLRPEVFNVYVDVPVSDINLGVMMGTTPQMGEEVGVTVGSVFDLYVDFLPNAGKNVFSNDALQKEVYFNFTRSYISRDWKNGHFVANTRSGANYDTITAYTFSNSYYRHLALQETEGITNAETLNEEMLRFFAKNPLAAVQKSIKIKVSDISVDENSLTMLSENSNFDVYVDKYFTLTTVSSNGNGALGLSIKDTSGVSQPNMLANVGIKVPNIENLKIYGGSVIRVDAAGNITEHDFKEDADYRSQGGISYYILPYTSPKSSSDFFWKFNATDAGEVTMYVNFFFENQKGVLQGVYNFSGTTNVEKKFTLSLISHAWEQDPEWKADEESSQDNTIRLTITYDEKGKPKTAEQNLSLLLNGLHEDNIYRTVKYFLVFDESNGDFNDQAVKDVFPNIGAAYYSTDYRGDRLGITSIPMVGGRYRLFELNGSLLVATKPYSGQAYVVAATIRTNAEGDPYYEDGHYCIVAISSPKTVLVESAFSITNMFPTFSFTQSFNEIGGYYYIPAINRENGMQQQVLSFSLTLTQVQNKEDEIRKIEQAFQLGRIAVLCVDGDVMLDDYVKLVNLQMTRSDGQELVFTGKLEINERLFEERHQKNLNARDNGLKIQLMFRYNNGTESFDKLTTWQMGPSITSFYIYYQQPVSLTGKYADAMNGFSADDEIVVNMTSDGMTISWGKNATGGDRLIVNSNDATSVYQALNELLSFTLVDQYGRPISDDTNIYSVAFVEENQDGTPHSSGVINLGDGGRYIANFTPTSSTPVTTRLRAYIVDSASADAYVPEFEESGNARQDASGKIIRLSSSTFTFKVAGEGVSKVKYDPSESLTVTSKDDFVESSNLGSVTVRKRIVKGSTNPQIELANLIEVYKRSNGENVLIEGLKFKINRSWLTELNASRRTDLLKMVHFNDGVLDDESSVDDLLAASITNMVFQHTFNANTTMRFDVTDSTGSLFNITLNFVCLFDGTISPNFKQYYDRYSAYLTPSANGLDDGIFSNQDYVLDDFTNFTSVSGSTYSWNTAFNGHWSANQIASSETGVFYSSSNQVKLVLKDGKATLSFGDFYKCTTVTIILYYGIFSTYALQTQIVVHVNPNIIIKEVLTQNEELPVMDIQNINTTNFNDMFKFYRATDYLAKNSFEGLEDIFTSLKLTINNTSSVAYLNVSEAGRFSFAKDGQRLSMTLGQKFGQSITLLRDSEMFNAIKARVVNGETIVTKPVLGKNFSINFNMTYGADVSNIMTTADGSPVKAEVYENGETYLLLIAGQSYIRQGNILFASVEGNYLDRQSSTSIFAGYVDNYFDANNRINAQTEISDGNTPNVHTMEITLTIRVIVSELGDTFVNYGTTQLPDLSTLVRGSAAQLTQSGIYAEFTAGNRYKVVHTSDDTSSAEGVDNGLGFVFKARKAISARLSVEQAREGLISVVPTSGNSTIQTDILIGHLENQNTAEYAILSLTVADSSGSFTWRFRIKITPSFVKGSMTYPFETEDGEFLDVYSNYYDSTSGEFVIDFNEEFTSENSYDIEGTKVGGTRFTSPTFNSDVANTSYKEVYSIGKVYNQSGQVLTSSLYISSEFNNKTAGGATTVTDSVLHLKLQDLSSVITVEIIKSFVSTGSLIDGMKLVGGDLVYNLRFNQGAKYSHSLTSQSGGATVTKIDENTYATKLVYDSRMSSSVYSFKVTVDERIGSSQITNPASYTYYVKQEGAVLAHSLNEGTLTLSLDALSKDEVVTIGFVTSQKRVFKFIVQLTSSYRENAVLNSRFVGGNTYKFKDSEGAGVFAPETSGSVSIKAASSETKTNMFRISAGAIEFAHLLEDQTFTFTAVFDSYSFDFDITVLKSFDVNNLVTTVDTNARYGGVGFDVAISRLLDENNLSHGTYSDFKFKGIATDNTEFYRDDYSVTITPNNVASQDVIIKTFQVSYKFIGDNGDYTFDSILKYQFTVNKNVNVVAKYPVPDGVNMSEAEYISTMVDANGNMVSENKNSYNNFFSSCADFSDDARAYVTWVSGLNSTGFTVTISAAELVNVRLIFTREGSSRTIVSGGDMYLFAMEEVNDLAELPEYSLRFELINAGVDGSARFEIIVNEVPVSYRVVVKNGSAITIAPNAPNYTNGRETIYAEDLVGAEQTIFAANRILQYAFKNNVIVGTEYYVRLVNEVGTREVVKIVVNGPAEEITEIVNQDIRKSLPGYRFDGVYKDEECTEAIREEDIFLEIPRLTQRVEVIYADGKVIKIADDLDNSNKLTLNFERPTQVEIPNPDYNPDIADSDTNKPLRSGKAFTAQEFILIEDDFEEVLSLEISIGVGESSGKISTGRVYNIYLTSDFEVGHNANTVDAYSVTVNAGTTESLLDYYKGFQIRKSSNKELYTPESMKASKAEMALRIYGFNDMPILNNTSDKLTKAAYDINARYGIIPVAGADLQPGGHVGTSTSSTKNYISIAGATSEESETDYDYAIRAQGAGNNGNYVLMRITYSVTFNIYKVKKEANLLFHVLPVSRIVFEINSAGDTFEGQSSEIDGETRMSNILAPYTLESNEEQITLWRADDKAMGAVKAYMHGALETTNNNTAQEFKYEYKSSTDSKSGYNDWEGFNKTFTQEAINGGNKFGSSNNTYGWENNKATKNEPGREGLKINVPSLELGERRMYVDMEDDFGFLARFYFQKQSALNPEIQAVSGTFTEGEKIAVGAVYSDMGQTNPEKNTVQYTFTYTEKKLNEVVPEEEKYNNLLQVKVEGNEDGEKAIITKIKFAATLNQSQDGEVTFEGVSGGTHKLVSGDTIFRIIEDENGLNDRLYFMDGENESGIKIYDKSDGSSKWRLQTANNSDGVEFTTLDNKTLQGARFSVNITFKADDKALPKLSTYTVKYQNVDETVADNKGWINLLQNYFVKNTPTPQLTTNGNYSADNSVIVRGIEAFGFDKDMLAIDVDSVTKKNSETTNGFISNINNIHILKMDFYRADNNKWLGSSLVYGDTEEKKYNGGKNGSAYQEITELERQTVGFFTDADHAFVVENEAGKKELVYGRSQSSGQTAQFTVPYINGYEFGYGKTLQVRLALTLQSDSNNCVAEYFTTITRAESTDKLFKVDIEDNSAPTLLDGGEIYNDTLEIELQAHESVEIIVHNDESLGSISYDDNLGHYTSGGIVLRTVSVSNNRDYAVTEYISITQSLANSVLNGSSTYKNFDGNSSFYVYVMKDMIGEGDAAEDFTKKNGGVGIKYNGEYVVDPTSTDRIGTYKFNNKDIDTYKGIILKIEDVSELSGTYKTEMLYFLKKGEKGVADGSGNNIYMVRQEFRVYPNYERVTTKNTAQNGDIKVTDYYIADNDDKATPSASAYYIIPINAWGQHVNLYKYASVDLAASTALNNEKAYKFHFEINSSESMNGNKPNGSAFIDENGTIITTSSFTPQSHYLVVDIYMKVAGFDGNYENNNTELSLTKVTTVSLALEAKSKANSNNGGEETYIINNSNAVGVISLPAGYKLYGSVSKAKQLVDLTGDYSYAFTAGTRVNLKSTLEGTTLNKKLDHKLSRNLNYHIVALKEVNDSSLTYIRSNNLNSYVFAYEGTYEAYIVATGRSADKDEIDYEYYKVKFTIYNQNSYTTKVVATSISNSSYALSGLNSNANSWMELTSDGGAKELKDPSITIGNAYEERTFLAISDTGSNVYKVTFLKYESTQNKTVAIEQEASYALSNLIDRTAGNEYKFYVISNDGSELIERTSQNWHNVNANNTREQTYYLVTTSATGESVTRYVVTFHIVPNSRSTYDKTIPVNSDQVSTDDIFTSIQEILSIGELEYGNPQTNENSFYVYQRSDKGVLTLLDRNDKISVVSGAHIYTATYVVEYRIGDGRVAFVNLTINFFLYDSVGGSSQGEVSLELYALSTVSLRTETLTAHIRNAVGGATNTQVSIHKLQNDTMGSGIIEIDLSGYTSAGSVFTQTYYVMVGTNYYLMHLTLNIMYDSHSSYNVTIYDGDKIRDVGQKVGTVVKGSSDTSSFVLLIGGDRVFRAGKDTDVPRENSRYSVKLGSGTSSTRYEINFTVLPKPYTIFYTEGDTVETARSYIEAATQGTLTSFYLDEECTSSTNLTTVSDGQEIYARVTILGISRRVHITLKQVQNRDYTISTSQIEGDSFTLSSITSSLRSQLGIPSTHTITYHSSMQNANSDIAITRVDVASTVTVYVKAVSGEDSVCYKVTLSFTNIV